MTKLCRCSFSFLSSIYHSIYHFFENDPRQSQNIIFICYDSLHVFSRMFKLPYWRVIWLSKRNVGVFVRCVKWLTCLLLKDLELARVYNNGRNKNKQWEKERKERERSFWREFQENVFHQLNQYNNQNCLYSIITSRSFQKLKPI